MSSSKITMGSERNFGLVFAGVFSAVGLLPLLGSHPPRLWSLAVAACFLLAALTRPGLLAPFNRLWFAFGLALGRVMTPIAMGVIFAVAVIPTAVIMKLAGKDPMQRRLRRDAPTYWERREQQPGPMQDQY